MAWCFEDEANAYADSILDRLLDGDARVPPIWPLEVANALLVAERRGRLTEAKTARIAQLLLSLPFSVEEGAVNRALGPVLGVGRAHGLSAYDAAYLELA